MLSGIAVYIGMFWSDMNSAMRIIITLGSGIVSYILALVSLGEARFEKSSTPLFLIAAFLQTTGLFVTLDEFSSGGNWRYAVLLISGTMFLQQALTFWSKKRTTLLFTSLLFSSAFIATGFDLIGMDEDLIAIVIGSALLCIAYVIDKSEHHPIASFWYFVGSISLLSGFFHAIHQSVFDILFLILSCFLMFISTRVQNRTLLTVSTLSLLGYISYFTTEHFVDSLGWPLVLIILGFVFFGISSYAFRRLSHS